MNGCEDFGIDWLKEASGVSRVLVKGLNLSYHDEETMSFTIDPYYGNCNLNEIP